MREKKAVTLVELLITLSLMAVLVIIMGSLGGSFYSLKKNFLDKQQSSAQGHLAITTIVERVLRGGTGTSGGGYTISDSGARLDYTRSSPTGRITETIRLDRSNRAIKYNDGTLEKVLLRDVERLNFSAAFGRRLAVEIDLQSGDKLRTCIQPRNEFTAQSVIN